MTLWILWVSAVVGLASFMMGMLWADGFGWSRRYPQELLNKYR